MSSVDNVFTEQGSEPQFRSEGQCRLRLPPTVPTTEVVEKVSRDVEDVRVGEVRPGVGDYLAIFESTASAESEEELDSITFREGHRRGGCGELHRQGTFTARASTPVETQETNEEPLEKDVERPVEVPDPRQSNAGAKDEGNSSDEWVRNLVRRKKSKTDDREIGKINIDTLGKRKNSPEGKGEKSGQIENIDVINTDTKNVNNEDEQEAKNKRIKGRIKFSQLRKYKKEKKEDKYNKKINDLLEEKTALQDENNLLKLKNQTLNETNTKRKAGEKETKEASSQTIEEDIITHIDTVDSYEECLLYTEKEWDEEVFQRTEIKVGNPIKTSDSTTKMLILGPEKEDDTDIIEWFEDKYPELINEKEQMVVLNQSNTVRIGNTNMITQESTSR
ncbi:hypothetical protein ABEB36_015824 [Hypothenemus hampei]|uniref:Uncharacterized protein n=1 Tax=Hypothenemus hampei TaxID=57062 RepID=A0ABD1E168_HYPHA